MEIISSSHGSSNSLRKKGCDQRFSLGEGDFAWCGVGELDPGDSYPSVSYNNIDNVLTRKTKESSMH